MKDGVTLVYLDQNVLDYFAKERFEGLREYLKCRDCQVIYSTATVDEINRTTDEDLRERFLSYLEESEAQYFWVDEEDLANFTNRAPEDVLDEHEENQELFGEAEDALFGLLFKFVGGRSDDDFESVIGENKTATNNLLDSVEQELESGSFLPEESEMLRQEIEDLKQQLSDSTEELGDQLEESIDSPVGFSAIDSFQSFTGLGPVQLNNIEPPDVIPQIWEALEESEEFDSEELTFEMLFGEEAWQEWFPEEPGIVGKINTLYNLLNTVGYYTDSKQDRERRFVATMSDHQHAGYAAFAHKLLSRDKRFVKKTRAVYEHLEIGTEIILLPS